MHESVGGPCRPEQARTLDGRFELEHRMGRDDLATVWRATDLQLERAVVVRLLHRELMDDPAVLERFRLEALAAAGLSHGHVASLFDVAVHDDIAYTVGEYVDGAAVARLIEEGPMQALAVAALGQQAASGLAAAHESGIIHRDIRPGNLLVGRDGRVRIVDFGSARIPDPRGQELDEGRSGADSYLAPEQLTGARSTQITDVYALGRTLIKALMGTHVVIEEPRIEDGLLDRVRNALHGISSGGADERRLTQAVTAATDPDPLRRPSAEQLAAALHSLCGSRGEALLRPLVEGLPSADFGRRQE